ncbi:MAG: MerR family transcriptional regulator [Dehalococcoidales bacterium]|nr:MerR family transcriptional regulator [Dehalococcoidales bacterium]
MEQANGVYIMRVASMLTGMHPQTLRKYERAGLLEPSRSKRLRMYSEVDIARLKTIKHLVDELGLNLAGVRLALDMQDKMYKIRAQMALAEMNENKKKKLVKALEESLIALGETPEDINAERGSGGTNSK